MDENFNKQIKKLVWNLHISPEEFEEKWNSMIEEFGLVGDPWFSEMYEIRRSWIPAYYKDLPMSGLMKTTSRSESANAFFNMYVKFNLNLCEFLNNYDSAIEKQRVEQSANENSTRMSLPRLVSPLKLEVHAANVYTRKIFWDVQKELKKAMWYCGIESVELFEGLKVYVVSHQNKHLAAKSNYKVFVFFFHRLIHCFVFGLMLLVFYC